MSTRLQQLLSQLGVDETRVLERIAERLVMGRKQYGLLNIERDSRDWVEEARMESFDLAVYLAIALIGEKS